MLKLCWNLLLLSFATASGSLLPFMEGEIVLLLLSSTFFLDMLDFLVVELRSISVIHCFSASVKFFEFS